MRFEMKIDESVDGTLVFTRAGQIPEIEPVKVDFKKKKIISAFGDDENAIRIEATEAVDYADLAFFILQPDTQFLRTASDCFVQAKLLAIEMDADSNGDGVVTSSIVLYKVSETLKTFKRK